LRVRPTGVDGSGWALAGTGAGASGLETARGPAAVVAGGPFTAFASPVVLGRGGAGGGGLPANSTAAAITPSTPANIPSFASFFIGRPQRFASDGVATPPL
jgi:hypothetical protein